MLTTTSKSRADAAPKLDPAASPVSEPLAPSDTCMNERVPDAAMGKVYSADTADRRGPFRPQTLISTRKHLRGDAAALGFRLIDAGAMATLSWIAIDRFSPAGVWASPVAAVVPVFAATVLLLAALKEVGVYQFRAREPLDRHLVKLWAAFGAASAITALCLWVGKAPETLVQTLLLGGGLCFAAIHLLHTGWWASVRHLRQSGRLTPTMVIVGANEMAKILISKALENGEMAVLGVFDDRLGRAPADICGVPVRGGLDDLVGHRIMPYVDRIVITVAPSAQHRVREIVDRLKILPNEVTLLVDAKDDAAASSALSRLADMPLAKVSGSNQNPHRALAKRLQDLVFSGFILLLAAPVMAVVALSVKLDSPGPILFRQRRHGFNNEEIIVWKFRSMRHETADNRALRQVSPDDDRVTRLGRFIRKTSLDELPQIWNVLRGEMSLVGPRPHAPAMRTGDVQSALLVKEYAHRHRMKPGMTGWAAIHGSRGPMHTPAQVRRRVALDIDYIERQSFWLDLYIMAMTLPCLLGDRHVAR